MFEAFERGGLHEALRRNLPIVYIANAGVDVAAGLDLGPHYVLHVEEVLILRVGLLRDHVETYPIVHVLGHVH